VCVPWLGQQAVTRNVRLIIKAVEGTKHCCAQSQRHAMRNACLRLPPKIASVPMSLVQCRSHMKHLKPDHGSCWASLGLLLLAPCIATAGATLPTLSLLHNPSVTVRACLKFELGSPSVGICRWWDQGPAPSDRSRPAFTLSRSRKCTAGIGPSRQPGSFRGTLSVRGELSATLNTLV